MKDDPFWNIDHEEIRMMGGPADGDLCQILRQTDRFDFITMDYKLSLSAILEKDDISPISMNPFILHSHYHRLAESNIFYCSERDSK